MNQLLTSIQYLTSFVLLLSGIIPGVFSQKNMTLVGHRPYPEMGSQVILNDIWGYVDQEGGEYALVGTFTGVSIVSLDDPTNPEEIFFVPGINSIWRDLKTYESFAYVSNESGEGIQIIDLSGLPEAINVKDTIINEVTTIHNLWQEGGFLYTAGMNNQQGGVMVLDLRNDPWKPEFIGNYTDTYVHDVFVRNNIAYTAEIFRGQFSIVDMQDPSNPRVLGSRRYTGGFTHNTWLNDSSTVCFTTDERSGAAIIAWDIRDPENIEELDRIRSSLSRGRATPHNVHVFNDFLVTSYYKDGIQIVDAHRPENLVEVGYYDTFPDSLGGTDGCWGAYPYLPSGLILASDIREGLFVFSANYERAAYFEGSVIDAVTQQPLADVVIEVIQASESVETNVNGTFKTGFLISDTATVIFTRNGYQSDTLTLEFNQGEVTQVDIALTPMDFRTLEIQVLDSISGNAIDSVQIQLNALNLNVEYEFLSSSQETLRNTLPTDTYELIAGKWGYQSIRQVIDFSDDSSKSIILRMNPGYYDDFILDFGWTTQSPSDQNIWQRAIPSPTTLLDQTLNPGEDVQGDLGEIAYVTDNTGQSFQDRDVDGGPFLLTSPVFDLTDYEDPWINYYWWMVSILPNVSFEAGNDTLFTLLSDGTTSQRIAFHTGPLNNTWQPHSVRISDYMTPGSNMRVTFEIEDQPLDDFVEAGIDLFTITDSTGLSTSTLPSLSQFRIYPNPVGEKLYISNLPGTIPIVRWELYNASGEMVSRGTPPLGDKEWEIAFPYAPGLYLLNLIQTNNQTYLFKLLKN